MGPLISIRETYEATRNKISQVFKNEITEEQLFAWAEDKLTDEEQEAVRVYIAKSVEDGIYIPEPTD